MLQRYAYSILKDEEMANDAVQSVFVKWWEIKTDIKNIEEAKAYLFSSVYRFCLNITRHQKVKFRVSETIKREMPVHVEFQDSLSFNQMDIGIKAAIDSLPDQCRKIFQKSRFDEMRYADIAREMNLSVKTIEAQMGKALKYLRESLHEFIN